MQEIITKAFVLAAGKGTRMLHLSKDCPKPLLEVDGKPMLDHALDSLEEAGVTDVVVNAHYLKDMIIEALEKRTSPNIKISVEEELLETAGGVKNMIEFFGDKPFFVLNADVVLTNNKSSSLLELAKKWDSTKMDVLLLMQPVATAHFYEGKGDYQLQNDFGTMLFAKHKSDTIEPNVVFTGSRIVHPKVFDKVELGHYGFLELFHEAEAKERLYGLVNDGEWFHVGTPEHLEETNKIFEEKKKRVA